MKYYTLKKERREYKNSGKPNSQTGARYAKQPNGVGTSIIVSSFGLLESNFIPKLTIRVSFERWAREAANSGLIVAFSLLGYCSYSISLYSILLPKSNSTSLFKATDREFFSFSWSSVMEDEGLNSQRRDPIKSSGTPSSLLSLFLIIFLGN